MHVSSLTFTHPTKLLFLLALVSFVESKWNTDNQRILTFKREQNSISINPSCFSKPAENGGIASGGLENKGR